MHKYIVVCASCNSSDPSGLFNAIIISCLEENAKSSLIQIVKERKDGSVVNDRVQFSDLNSLTTLSQRNRLCFNINKRTVFAKE